MQISILTFLIIFLSGFSNKVHAFESVKPLGQRKPTRLEATTFQFDRDEFRDLLQEGVPAPALERVLHFIHKAEGHTIMVQADRRKVPKRLENTDQVVIIDYSQPSVEKRLFLIDLEKRTVEKHLVAHGVGSGGLEAQRFSNKMNSKQSSLGFYMTGPRYMGKWGVALKLFGLEKSNDQAYSRYVVMHGAPYVSSDFIEARGFLGRSHGCPALELDVAKALIPQIENGTLIYAYHKDLSYEAFANPQFQELDTALEQNAEETDEEKQLNEQGVIPRI